MPKAAEDTCPSAPSRYLIVKEQALPLMTPEGSAGGSSHRILGFCSSNHSISEFNSVVNVDFIVVYSYGHSNKTAQTATKAKRRGRFPVTVACGLWPGLPEVAQLRCERNGTRASY